MPRRLTPRARIEPEIVVDTTRRAARLELTREYATMRRHPLVDAMIGVEHSRSLARGAAALLDRDPSASEIDARP